MNQPVHIVARLARLADLVRDELQRTGQVSMRRLSAESGTAESTWKRVLAGEWIERADSRKNMETHLGWRVGDFERVVNDPDFEPGRFSPQPAEPGDLREQIREIARAQGDLTRLVDQLASAVGLDDPQEQRRSR